MKTVSEGERSVDEGCLRNDDSPVSVWFDNYDLDVCTPRRVHS